MGVRERRAKWYDFLGPVQASPPSLLPFINFALDPVTQNPGIWTLALIVGSEENLFGAVGDPDAGPLKPIQGVEAFLDGVPMDPSGMIISNSTEDPVAWSYSSTVFKLTDDGKTFMVRVTDFDGNTDEASVQIDMLNRDPLQQLSGHGFPDSTDWIWTAATIPTWVDDSVNGGTTWADTTNGSTGYGGLVILNSTTKHEIVLTATENKSYTVQAQILSPNNDSWALFEIDVDGFITDPGEAVVGPTTFAQPDEVNLFAFRMDLLTGETMKFRIWGEVNGVENDSTRPVLTFMDIIESTAAPPPLPGTEIFSTAGMEKTGWDAYRASLPLNVYGRPSGQVSKKYTIPGAAGYKMFALSGTEVPTMEAGTEELLHIAYVPAARPQQFIAMVGSGPKWNDWYLPARNPWLFEFEMGVEGQTLNVWRDPAFSFAMLFECWMPMGWNTTSNETPLQIIINNPGGATENAVYLTLRGTAETTPSVWQQTNHYKIAELTLGVHRFKLEVQWDHGATAYAKVFWGNDPDPVVNVPVGTMPIGANTAPNGINGELLPNWGLYEFESYTGIQTRTRSVKVRDLA